MPRLGDAWGPAWDRAEEAWERAQEDLPGGPGWDGDCDDDVDGSDEETCEWCEERVSRCPSRGELCEVCGEHPLGTDFFGCKGHGVTP